MEKFLLVSYVFANIVVFEEEMCNLINVIFCFECDVGAKCVVFRNGKKKRKLENENFIINVHFDSRMCL